MKPREGLSKREVQRKALKKRGSMGGYPKGDYRQGMPKVQRNLKMMREKNKIISSLD